MRLSNSAKWAEVRPFWTASPAAYRVWIRCDTSIQFSFNSKWIDATSNSIHICVLLIHCACGHSTLCSAAHCNELGSGLNINFWWQPTRPIAKQFLSARARSFPKVCVTVLHTFERALSSFTWFMAEGFVLRHRLGQLSRLKAHLLEIQIRRASHNNNNNKYLLTALESTLWKVLRFAYLQKRERERCKFTK